MAAAINPSRGEAHYASKLTDDQCREIMGLRQERARLLAEAANLTDAKIAERYGVHPNTVWKYGNYAQRIDATMHAQQLPLNLMQAIK